MLDLTLPKDHVELSLCGCLMLDASRVGAVTDEIDAEDFAEPDARALFVAIVKTWGKEKPLEPANVAVELPVDVPADVAYEAYGMVGSSEFTNGLVKEVKDASLRRRLNAEGRRVATMAKQDNRDVGTVLGDAQAAVLGVQRKDSQLSLSDILARIQRESEEASKNPTGLRGVSYGVRTLDNITGGMHKNDFIVVAARPSVGKSAFVKSCMVHNHLMNGTGGVAVFTAEDSSDAFLLRLISQEANIDFNRLKRGDLNREEWARYTEVCTLIDRQAKDRLLLDDRPRPTPGYVMNKCRQWKAAGKPLDFVVIDYLQKMGRIGGNSGYEQATQLVYAVDDLKKDLGMPIVLVAQLRRDGEGREGILTPTLTDLKETGALEEAATVVLLLHRENRGSVSGRVIVGKNKNGPTGHVDVDYAPTTTTYKEKQ